MERFELNTMIDRPIKEVFAVLSNLENDLVVDINSIYHDASMIPLCSDKRNSLYQVLLDGCSGTHLCLRMGGNLSFDAPVTKSRIRKHTAFIQLGLT